MPPDCSITPTRGRSARASAAGSMPRTATVPASGRRYPSQISIVVVLPAPFGPRTAVTAPRLARRLSPSTAALCPYRLTRSRISTAGVSVTLASVRGHPGRRGGDQRLDQARVLPRLGVPLHREQERSTCGARLHRLDDPVLRPGGGDQAVAEPVDGLVMRGRHVDPVSVNAEDPGQPGARRDPHRVQAEGPRGRGMPGVAGQVL